MRALLVGDAGSINVRRWAEGLVNNGWSIEMLSFEPGWNPDIPVTQIPDLGGPRARYVFGGLWARNWARRRRFDLVCGYYVSGYGTVARMTNMHPLVLITAGRDVVDVPTRSLRRRITAMNLAAADLVLCWGHHMADAAADFGVDPDRIFVQPRGIPLGRYRPRIPDTSRAATKAIVTRSLEPVYRHAEILEAMASIREPTLTLTVVGDGSLRSDLEARAAELGLAERVEFLGRVDNDTLPDLLAQHEIYVSARPHDGVSASLLEAMAAGLTPVIADHPANRDFIEDGSTGLLVEPDVEGLKIGLLRAASDSSLRLRANETGPRVVAERGDIEKNMATYSRLLADLAAGTDNRPRKIAMVIDSLGAGGAERVLARVAGGLADAGEEVTVITFSERSDDFHSLSENVDRVSLGLVSASRNVFEALLANVRRIWALRRAIAGESADVVVAFTARMNVLTLAATVLTTVPVIVSERVDPRQHRFDRLTEIGRRLLYRRARKVVVQSAETLSWAADLVGPDDAVVIPNAAPPVRMAPSSARRRVIVGIGRLVPQKGFDIAIEALAPVLKAHPDWSYEIYGVGPDADGLKRQAAGLGVADQVRFVGLSDDVASVLSLAGIFVLSSRYEGYPNVLLEALAAGCPSIAFACPTGPAEILSEGEGLLVPDGDDLRLRKAAAELIEDDACRQRIGETGQRAAERHSPEVELKRWRDLIRSVALRQGGRRGRR